MNFKRLALHQKENQKRSGSELHNNEKRLRVDNNVKGLFSKLDTLTKQVSFLGNDNRTKVEMYDYLLKETFINPELIHSLFRGFVSLGKDATVEKLKTDSCPITLNPLKDNADDLYYAFIHKNEDSTCQFLAINSDDDEVSSQKEFEKSNPTPSCPLCKETYKDRTTESTVKFPSLLLLLYLDLEKHPK